ncbi:MAG: hypothetical protein RLZZ609_747 [Cyanobacteriota bacterium]|jgi:hypothetical protein
MQLLQARQVALVDRGHRLLEDSRVVGVAPSSSTLAAKASLITWRGTTTPNTNPLASI